MKILRLAYYAGLVITLLTIVWFIQLNYELEQSRILAVQGGYWDPSMGGAGMALLAPFIIGTASILVTNLVGVALLILNRKRKTLHVYESRLIIGLLVSMFAGYALIVLLNALWDGI